MSSVVTALYETRQEAEYAARSVETQIPLSYLAVHDGSQASITALGSLDLTTEERRRCERNLADGGYLLIAQARHGKDTERVVSALENAADQRQHASSWPEPRPESAVPDAASPLVAEESVPLVEEELRVGTREVVRGGARVRTRVEELPVVQEVELLEEFVRMDRRPVDRRITEEELREAGLLKERVIEVAQMREEAVVTKEAFVREEVVLTKTTERRVEQIRDTVRHTEVETETLGVGSPASS